MRDNQNTQKIQENNIVAKPHIHMGKTEARKDVVYCISMGT